MTHRRADLVVAIGLFVVAFWFALSSVSFAIAMLPGRAAQDAGFGLFLFSMSTLRALYLAMMLDAIFQPMAAPFGAYSEFFLVGGIAAIPLGWLAWHLARGRAWARHVTLAFLLLLVAGSAVTFVASFMAPPFLTTQPYSSIGNAAIAIAAAAGAWALLRARADLVLLSRAP